MTEQELLAKVTQDVATHGDMMLLLRMRILQGKPIADVIAAKAESLEGRVRAALQGTAGPVAGGTGQPVEQVQQTGPGGAGGNDPAHG